MQKSAAAKIKYHEIGIITRSYLLSQATTIAPISAARRSKEAISKGNTYASGETKATPNWRSGSMDGSRAGGIASNCDHILRIHVIDPNITTEINKAQLQFELKTGFGT